MNPIVARIAMLLPFLALALRMPLHAQESSLGAVVGLHGLKTIVPEIGIGYSVEDDDHLGMWHGFTLASEISAGERTVIGVAGGAWWTVVFLNLGAGLIYYTAPGASALRLRPEIGLGRGSFRLTYGLQLTITNPAFDGIPKHEIALRWMLPLLPVGK